MLNINKAMSLKTYRLSGKIFLYQLQVQHGVFFNWIPVFNQFILCKIISGYYF